MIEKIPFETEVLPYKDKTIDVQTHASPYDLQIKINELVDTVNTIQKEREAERFEIQEWIGILEAVRKSVNVHEKQIDELQMKLEPEKCETSADPYAEQQKWIGKLCKFWDYDGEEKWFSILEHIDKNSPYTYCASGDWWYKHCELVKPDDDIIYKGEQQ